MPSPARTSSRVEQCLIAPQGTVHNKLHQNTLQLSFLYTAHTLTNTTTIRSTAPFTRARIQPALTTAPHHHAITVVRAGLRCGRGGGRGSGGLLWWWWCCRVSLPRPLFSPTAEAGWWPSSCALHCSASAAAVPLPTPPARTLQTEPAEALSNNNNF